MKRVICLIVVLVLCLSLVACGARPTEPGSFFPNASQRFILVDEGRISGIGKTDIYADTVTGVLYMWVHEGYQAGITPLLCADGTPMLYDPD